MEQTSRSIANYRIANSLPIKSQNEEGTNKNDVSPLIISVISPEKHRGLVTTIDVGLLMW
jgi:hypothetical protein